MLKKRGGSAGGGSKPRVLNAAPKKRKEPEINPDIRPEDDVAVEDGRIISMALSALHTFSPHVKRYDAFNNIIDTV
jgi:hypothetical protein